MGRSYRRDVVRKATSGRRGLGALMSWGPGKLRIRYSKESHHPAEWASGPPVEHQEKEKDITLTAIRVGVKMLQFLFGLQLPWITFSNLTNILRGTYLLKKSSCVFIIVSLWCCRWQYNTCTSTLTQSGIGNNGNEGVLHIPQNPRIRSSPSDAV